VKTHDLAKGLTQLSNVLRAGSNIEIEELSVTSLFEKEVVVNLKTLVALSDLDKQYWSGLIQNYGFPIKIRPRDASRDIIGKLIAYLSKNPESLDILQEDINRGSGKASPELMRALSSLLKG